VAITGRRERAANEKAGQVSLSGFPVDE